MFVTQFIQNLNFIKTFAFDQKKNYSIDKKDQLIT